MVANTRSVKGKIAELQAACVGFDVVCLTETHLDKTVPSQMLFDSSNWVVHRKDRNIHGGGVLIAIGSNICHSLISFSCADEIVGIVISDEKPNNNLTVIACFYRPPGNNTQDELPFFSEIFTGHPLSQVLVVGDFNMPDICWNTKTVRGVSNLKCMHQQFLGQLYEYSLHQIVAEPTHVKGNILDLVCTNTPESISDIEVVKPGLSDHYIIEFSMKVLEISSVAIEPKVVRLYDRADLGAVDQVLAATNLRIDEMISANTDIDEVWNFFEQDLKKNCTMLIKKNMITICWLNTKQ